MAHVDQIAVLLRLCMLASFLDAKILNALAIFSSVTHHASIVLGLPANHMSGLLMFVRSDINHFRQKIRKGKKNRIRNKLI